MGVGRQQTGRQWDASATAWQVVWQLSNLVSVPAGTGVVVRCATQAPNRGSYVAALVYLACLQQGPRWLSPGLHMAEAREGLQRGPRHNPGST